MTLPLNSNDKILKNYKRFRESCDLNLHLAQIDVHISVTCVGGFSTLLKIWIVLMLPLLLLYIAQKSSLCRMFHNQIIILKLDQTFHIRNESNKGRCDSKLQRPPFVTLFPSVGLPAHIIGLFRVDRFYSSTTARAFI